MLNRFLKVGDAFTKNYAAGYRVTALERLTGQQGAKCTGIRYSVSMEG